MVRTSEIALNCAYGADGGSQGVTCSPPGKSATCTPGCKHACNPDADPGRQWGCAWAPTNLKQMVEQQKILEPRGGYNEVIVDAFSWQRGLPRTIMAVYVAVTADGRPARKQDFDYSKQVHTDFLHEYGLTAADAPLLAYSAFVQCDERACDGPAFRDISDVDF